MRKPAGNRTDPNGNTFFLKMRNIAVGMVYISIKMGERKKRSFTTKECLFFKIFSF